jgi:cytochrome c oxidase subunit 4
MTSGTTSQHIISYGVLTKVWVGLLLMSGLTVFVSRLGVGSPVHFWGPLVIALAKAGLVIAFFMHMRYEGRLLRWLLFIPLLMLAIFIGGTFFEVLYR